MTKLLEFTKLRTRVLDRAAVAKHTKRAIILSTNDSTLLMEAIDKAIEHERQTTGLLAVRQNDAIAVNPCLGQMAEEEGRG
jgi:hypothetical protein